MSISLLSNLNNLQNDQSLTLLKSFSSASGVVNEMKRGGTVAGAGQSGVDSYTPSSATDSAVASALQTAESDGVQLVQWMQDQASGSLKSVSSATGTSLDSGASLTSQFSSDLSALGAAVNGEAGSRQASDMLAVESTLNGAIWSATHNGASSGDYSLSISDSSLSTSSSRNRANAGASAEALSIHITNYNSTASSGGGQGSYDLAINYSSNLSSTASSTSVSNGSTTLTESSSSVQANSAFALQADVQTGNGESVLTRATESTSVYVAEQTISETGYGSASTAGSSLSAGSGSLQLASATIQAGVSAQSDAALMTLWEQTLYGTAIGSTAGSDSSAAAKGTGMSIYA